MNLRIISWEKVSDDIFKVVAVTSNMSGEKDQDSFQQAIDEALGYGWKVLDNYNKKIVKDGNTYIRLVLKVLPLEVEAKDTEAMVNFEPITAKLYRNSTDDSLWTVAKTENGEKLVRNDLPDGEEILQENCTPEMNADVEDLINPDVYAGDYVSYVNPEGEIKEGFVDNSEDNSSQFVVDLSGEEEEITASAQYLSVVPSTTKIVASYQLDGMDPSVTSRELINHYYNDPDLMEEIHTLLGDQNFINPDEAALALITSECSAKLHASVAVTAGKVLYNVKAEFEKETGEELDLDIATEADSEIQPDGEELVVDVITDNPEALKQAVANCQGDGYELDFEEVESGCDKDK